MYALNPTDVRDVLQHLSRDRTPVRTPLADLEIVRRQLADAGLQATPEACVFEIGQLLTQVVETELRQLRARVAVTARTTDNADPRGQVLADFRAGNLDLEAWSAVYHVYLRPDLRLDLRSLERLLADRHRRTIQRRLKSGTESLAARLENLERAALQTARRERLLTGLPRGATDTPIGADDLIRQVRAGLDASPRPSIVALGGPPGIGKTALAAAIVRSIVARAQAAEPIWLAAPAALAQDPSPEALASALAVRCGLEGARAGALRDWLAREGRLVVVDELDDVRTAARVAQAARALPASASVLLVGRVCWSGVEGVRAIVVPPLDPPPALHLLREELARRGLQTAARASDDDLLPVVAASRGVPAVLRAAAAELRLSDPRRVARAIDEASGSFASLLEQMWSRQWWSVQERARQATELAIATRAHVGRPSRSDLVRAWPGDGASLDAALRDAVDAGLLEAIGPAGHWRYRCAPFLAGFVLGLTGPMAAFVPASTLRTSDDLA